MPNKEYLNLQDIGCNYATRKLGKQGRCVECPFKVCIINSLADGRKYASREVAYRKIFKMLDSSYDITQIRQKVRYRDEFISNAINKRDKIENILNDFETANRLVDTL